MSPKRAFPLAALLVLLAPFALPQAANANDGTRVRVTTNFGAFVIQLEESRAPLTSANFLRYVRERFYDGTLFHRVLPNFVVQGGGVTPDFRQKRGREPIVNESGNGLKNLRGTVGMARASGPHTADTQFYVNVADNGDLDPLPTRWGYAVFGRVVEGMEVVDRISLVPTGPRAPFTADVPQRDVLIERIEVVSADGAPEASTAPAPAAPASPPPAAPPAAP